MGKQTIIYVILYVVIISTMLNILFFSNKKYNDNPKIKHYLKLSVIVGIIIFSIAFVAFLTVFK